MKNIVELINIFLSCVKKMGFIQDVAAGIQQFKTPEKHFFFDTQL